VWTPGPHEASAKDFTIPTIDLTVWSLRHLNAIISSLHAAYVMSGIDSVTGLITL